MSTSTRVLIENGCYHIIARGNQKQNVFLEDVDFKAYLKRLMKYKRKFDFKLYGFCLMPNHVHLVGQIRIPKNLSKIMQAVTRSHTAYFNNKYLKVGHLWQGRFKNKIIAKDQYMVDCINYVELNPIRAGIVDILSEYQWSSYRERALNKLFFDYKLIDQLPL